MKLSTREQVIGGVILVTWLAAMLWAISAGAHEEAPTGICGPRAKVISQLAQKHNEKPVSMGLASNGTVVEVLNSPDGTWTIVMTAPNGVTCLLVAGEYWRDVLEEKEGT